MFKVRATVKRIGQKVNVTEKFSKRELVVEIPDDKYPQTVLFEAAQDKCDLLDGIMEGQEIEVSFSLRGREWTNDKGEVKVFNTISLFRIDGLGSAAPQAKAVTSEDENGDLPF